MVCDAGPVLHLDELDCLHLLNDFSKVILPDIVVTEVFRHRNVYLDTLNNMKVEAFNLSDLEEPLKTMCRMFALDAGEIGTLFVASRYNGLTVLTDDAAARLVAQRCQFNVHGTIGVIIRSIRMGSLTPEKVVSILQTIPEKSTLYIKPALLEKVISEVKMQSLDSGFRGNDERGNSPI